MKLSVIIVNYNVEYFLEQCLHSVYKAAKGLDVEVIVVDNASVDGSLGMLKEKFPSTLLIANEDNVGFSKANNQGIRISKGDYVLLLNPDTVVQEDTFQTTIDFMDKHPDAGGLGVRMLDGNGRFLPESKRGLPTPSVAFHKIFGLSALFPKSKRFNQYHLGNLSEEGTHEIDILSGAFMMMRKHALDKVGLLDEEFFMYGEDIDLSYRLTKGGYKNYYTSDTRIIHYKGESTKKSSINYVFVFYKAMIIFAKKHFSDKNAKLFSFFINLAIWFRAGLALIQRAIKTLIVPLLDALIIIGLLFLVKDWYQDYSGKIFPALYYQIAFPLYALTWVMALALNGAYIKPVRLKNIVIGMLYGTAGILIVYSLISDTFRFSRAMILIGAVASMLAILLFRFLLSAAIPSMAIGKKKDSRYAVVGGEEEVARVSDMLQKVGVSNDNIVSVHPDNSEAKGFVGSLKQLTAVIGVHQVNEIIFCARDLRTGQIMDQMAASAASEVSFKIAPPESMFIIGSDSSETSGELLAFDMNSIARKENRLNKRILDFSSSMVILLASPLLIFLQRRPLSFFPNLIKVLVGHRSWIGYDQRSDTSSLPKIRTGILSPIHPNKELESQQIQRANVLYSKDYAISRDINILFDQIRHLGS